jgi:hypothetical protein
MQQHVPIREIRLMPMRKVLHACALLAATMFLALAQVAHGQEEGGRDSPSVDDPCPECGVIYEIREVRREREAARNVPKGPVAIEPIIRFSLGDKADRGPHIDVYGSPSTREAMIEKYYEVVVSFDDGRWGRIEVPDASGLKAGDRIHVHKNRIELPDSDIP